jgi:Fic family protein
VPPPVWEVGRLLENLAVFLTETGGNPVIRAALAHAQFEAIRPFIDGNGRTGRALIHSVLRRADALLHILVPISTVFAAEVDSYIAGLTSYRAGDSDAWVLGFCRATEVAASTAVRLADDLARLDDSSVERIVAFRR